jgi:serine/threonine protein kinase
MSKLFNKVQELEKICEKSLNQGCNKKTLSKCDIKELGSGNFGMVKKCLNTNDNEYAVKMVKTLSTPTPEKKVQEKINLVNEAIIMINIGDHDNIVKIMGINITPLDYGYDDYEISILLEICNLGSLKSQLLNLKQNNQHIDTKTLQKIVFEIANGMVYLAQLNVVHNDLATRNVLLSSNDNNFTAKIGDFGLARKLNDIDSKLGYTVDNSIGGPFLWLSPESLSKNMYSEKSDVWSFGILLYEIEIDGESPIYKNPNDSNFKVSKDTKKIFEKMLIVDDIRHESKKILPKYLDDIMHSCWKLNPHERPSFKDIMDKLILNMKKQNSNIKKITTAKSNKNKTISKKKSISKKKTISKKKN